MNTLLLLIVSIHKVCATKSDAPCCFGTLCVEIWFKQIWSIVSGCWNYTTWIASRVSKIASTHSFQDVPPWSRTLQARWGDDISDCTNVWESVTVQLAFQRCIVPVFLFTVSMNQDLCLVLGFRLQVENFCWLYKVGGFSQIERLTLQQRGTCVLFILSLSLFFSATMVV